MRRGLFGDRVERRGTAVQLRGCHARVAAGMALAVLLAACGRSGTSPPPRNLLLISVDTLRYDALGFAGHAPATTPVLDTLAAGGTSFSTTLAPMPRTTPSLGSLLTGVWPQTHLSREVGDRIDGSLPTLATLLQDRGFRTLAVSANDTAGPNQGLDRGFDFFVDYREILRRYEATLYYEGSEVPASGVGWAEAVTEQALRLVDESPVGPYFLWLFYFDPHFVYRPPSPWQEGAEAEACWDAYQDYGQRRHEAGRLFSNVRGAAEPLVEPCRRLYDAEIAYTDAQIGELLTGLEERGQLADTLVVFTADHGENFGEGNLYFEHGDNAHDAGLRVPLVFSGPGVARGRVDATAVGLTDVLPTVLARLGIQVGTRVDGEDLSPRLAADRPPSLTDPRRVVFAESATAMWNETFQVLTTGRTWWRVCINGPRYTLCEIPGEDPGVYSLYDHQVDPELAVDLAAQHPREVEALLAAWQHWPPESARERVAHTGRFKLVQRPRLDGDYDSTLYDLEADPAETTDRTGDHPEVAQRLRERLEAWAASIPPPGARSEDPELEATLRNLGYVR